ncbi:MobF family relaxase [Embleya sp. NBC_00896]|uniref:MobF family relaxase n=1 Tax=Embleya sp. NBC_00896 TaxID=2975961 RepID=UPI00386E9FB3|nr:relaxase domain-containing protein [Embleya sp. NBC_00896]
MLTISAGSDHRYLTDQVGRGAEHYYLKAIEVAGEPPGIWLGAGAAAFGLRGEVDAEVMGKLYGELVDPLTGASLGAPPRKYRDVEQRLADALAALPDEATPEERDAVAGRVRATQVRAVKYLDLTFSAPKSWSVFHAALQADGRHAEAQAVWDAWMEGVRAGLDHLQEHAGFSRAGHNGVRRVDAHEWIVAAFRQHTSRDDDPQLHVHCAVLNRVRSVEVHPYTGQRTERWRTLDGRAVYAHRPAAAAVAERVAEEALTRTLKVRFATRPDGKAREILGVSEEVREQFSSRRRAISAKVAAMVDLYKAVRGHSPSAYEITCIAQTATLHTRAPKKKESVPREELLARWERTVTTRLRESLAGVARRVFDAGATSTVEPFDPDRVISRAVQELTATRPTFRRAELVAELNRQLPDSLGGLTPREVETLLEELATRALSPQTRVPDGPVLVRLAPPDALPTPSALLTSDGTSRYARPEAVLYTTVEHLDVEARIIAHAVHGRAPAVAEASVGRFLAGRTLGVDQAAAVRDLATAGRFVDVLVGPAGTGKSYTIAALCALWEANGGTVKGLAVGQRQARVMADEGVSRVANVRRFLNANAAIAAGEAVPDRDLYIFHAGELVIVDEAGTCATADLEKILSLAAEAGAKVVLAGDHGQTAEIGAGGMFGLLARDLPHTHTLEEVRRFHASWEREASLRVREGDAEVFAEYDVHGRVHGGGLEEMKEAAYQGWLVDHLSGVDALLVVPTRELAAELSGRARAQLVRLGRVEASGVPLADGNLAGRGDRVQLRRNDPKLTSSALGHWATNREVVRVLERHADGGLTVAYDDGETLRVPAAYVRNHVELAYAGTVHAVQGRTVDAAHALVALGMSREQLYVALTRARAGNHVYLAAAGPDETGPQGVFAAVLGRTEAQRSATEALRDAFAEAESLRAWAPVWSDLVEQRAAADCLSLLVDELGAESGARVEDDLAFGALTRLVRRVEGKGFDAYRLLRAAVRVRGLADADSIAEVLHWRLERELSGAARSVVVEREREARAAWRRQERSILATTLPTRSQVPVATPVADTDFAELVQVQQQLMLTVEVVHAGQAAAKREQSTAAEQAAARARSGYLARTPTANGPVGEHLRRLAEAMDRRVNELGCLAAQSPPLWAVERLGTVPADAAAREEWTRRAGIVSNYREAYGYAHRSDAIGPAPAPDAVDARHAWDRAAEALDPAAGADRGAAASEADLHRALDRYEREELWAPPHVAGRLKAAAQEQARWQQARVQALMASWIAPTAKESEAARRAAELAEVRVAKAASETRTLESVHAARLAWYAHTSEARERARAARAELDRRRDRRIDAAKAEGPGEAMGWAPGTAFSGPPPSGHKIASTTSSPRSAQTRPGAEPMSLEEASARAARARAIIEQRRQTGLGVAATGFTPATTVTTSAGPADESAKDAGRTVEGGEPRREASEQFGREAGLG